MASASFAEWHREVRSSRPGWSQDHLAAVIQLMDKPLPKSRKTKISQARISEWERGVLVPNFRQFMVVARVLNLTEDELSEGRRRWEAAQLHDEPSVVETGELPAG